MSASALLGEPRRDADAQAAGHQLDQRPAAGRLERVEPALRAAPASAAWWRAAASRPPRASVGGGPASGFGAPDQRQRSRRDRRHSRSTDANSSAPISPRRSCAAAPAWRPGSRARRSAPPAPSRGRDRASAADSLDQPQLGVARGLEGERQQLGEGLHRQLDALPAGEGADTRSARQLSSSSSRPARCSASASMPLELRIVRPARPRGRASPRPWARRHPSSGLASARPSRHGRR